MQYTIILQLLCQHAFDNYHRVKWNEYIIYKENSSKIRKIYRVVQIDCRIIQE